MKTYNIYYISESFKFNSSFKTISSSTILALLYIHVIVISYNNNIVCVTDDITGSQPCF